MPSIDIGIEISLGKEASSEILLSIDFKYRSGSPAHYGSLSYPGHPAEPPEIEIETIFWPIERFDAEKNQRIADHIEMPESGLPDGVLLAIEQHIWENYTDDGDDYEDF